MTTLADWVAELTPMDVAKFSFVSDAAGKVLLQLVEADGRTVSANIREVLKTDDLANLH